jgi:hypothetical protein
MTIETRYSIDDEVWWKKYPNIRHGKVYGVWVERGGISYGIIESNGARFLYVEECMLFPTKEELLKNL